MISAIRKAQFRSIHPFPARMAPSIVWDALSNTDQPLRILDPMAGSGTTLVCAKAKGHYAIGCDTDPLALLIAKAWCSDVHPEKLYDSARNVLEQAKHLANQIMFKNAYPEKADDETRQFIDFWFDDENRRQLTALSTCISQVKSDNERTLLWCAFSRLIITKTSGASLAMDVSHSRPHRVYDIAPIRPFDRFLKSVDFINNSAPFRTTDRSTITGPVAEIHLADARKIPIPSQSIDMIITSPPYLNAIDYLRGHKLSLVWLGYSIGYIRNLRSTNIGSEVSHNRPSEKAVHETARLIGKIESLDTRRFKILLRYLHDMNDVIKECARVLKKKGKVIFVIGNSTFQGVFIKNSDALVKLAANHDLSLDSRAVRTIPDNKRYLPPPDSKRSGKQLQARMKEEVVLKFIAD